MAFCLYYLKLFAILRNHALCSAFIRQSKHLHARQKSSHLIITKRRTKMVTSMTIKKITGSKEAAEVMKKVWSY